MTAEMEMAAGPNHVNGFAESAEDTKPTVTNPYETDPDKIPKDDPFLSQSAHYGRYTPHPTDFTPRSQNWYQSDPITNAHWEEIAQKYCAPEYSLNVAGRRQAFAAGSVIVRVDRDAVEGAAVEMYSCANANELSAARKVEESLREIGIAVPVIHFCGTIEGRNVTVESRIPGVSLEVAWRYLTAEQIALFKNQCRQILQQLAMIDKAPGEPSYVCRGLNSQSQPDVEDRERDILFSEDKDGELCLTHNDLVPANIIVRDGRVVGITGWRQCGYFGSLRAKKVHRFFRRPEPGPQHSPGGAGEDATWLDLYDDVYDPNKGTPLAASHDAAQPSVKTEPTSSTLEQFPASDDLETKSLGLDGAEDHPTSKKVATLKHGLTSRASSSDRSSPATSIRTAASKKAVSGATKKGTVKKATNKKHKVNDPDADSIDGRRSNTPVSRSSKTPASKKQGSMSAAGSPAPEDKKTKPKKKKKGGKSSTVQVNDEEDSEDENEVFCICRRPDNHTWMIGCDGGCEDWFHGKCVNIDPRDADLIDKYICPNCNQRGKGCTTWKPMCRLAECRKPARVTRKNPSKYCSDEHGREFMRRQTRHLRSGSNRSAGRLEELGSMGGVLTAGDLKAAIMGVATVEEFRKLGDRIISPPPEADETDENSKPGKKTETTFPHRKKLGLDIHANGMTYSADEAAKIEKLRKLREELLHRKDMLASRSVFVGLLRQRAKSVVEKLKQHEPKGGWKDICGFDSRLSWSDEEFDEWRLSEAGKKALAEGTAEALAASYPTMTDADGDTAMNDDNAEDEIAFLTRGICTKKRCERHKQWVKVQQQDIVFEESSADQDMAKCEEEAQVVVEKAALRMWAEKDNVPSKAD